jgi:hypothetical protein
MLTTDSTITLQKLYEIDYHLWLEKTITILKNNELQQLDLVNLIEELESLSRRDRAKVASLLKQIIIHLLLLEYWREELTRNKNHWQGEVLEFRDQLDRLLTNNLRNYLESELEQIYQNAVKFTAKKMNCNPTVFGKTCPYTFEQLLTEDWFPQ